MLLTNASIQESTAEKLEKQLAPYISGLIQVSEIPETFEVSCAHRIFHLEKCALVEEKDWQTKAKHFQDSYLLFDQTSLFQIMCDLGTDTVNGIRQGHPVDQFARILSNAINSPGEEAYEYRLLQVPSLDTELAWFVGEMDLFEFLSPRKDQKQGLLTAQEVRNILLT